MFRKFFAALSALTLNTEALAVSMAEANERFRANLALDHVEDVPALPAPEEDAEPARNKNGRTRTKATA